jgi:DNA-binding NtrC family response regulator
LRDRRGDVPDLVQWFLSRYAPTQPIKVTPAAMKALLQYDWPGNIRELENCVERAIALGDQQVIDVDDLPPAIRALSSPANGGESLSTTLSSTDLEDIERATIQRVFEQVNGDKTLAGQLLGISRATLYRKLKRYGIGSHAEAMAAANVQ